MPSFICAYLLIIEGLQERSRLSTSRPSASQYAHGALESGHRIDWLLLVEMTSQITDSVSFVNSFYWTAALTNENFPRCLASLNFQPMSGIFAESGTVPSLVAVLPAIESFQTIFNIFFLIKLNFLK